MYIDQIPDGMNGVTVGWCWEWKSRSRFFFQNKIPFKFVKSSETIKKARVLWGSDPGERHCYAHYNQIFTTTLFPSFIAL